MNSILTVYNGTKHPDYFIFCPDCAFEYKSFEDTHFCPYKGCVIDIEG